MFCGVLGHLILLTSSISYPDTFGSVGEEPVNNRACYLFHVITWNRYWTISFSKKIKENPSFEAGVYFGRTGEEIPHWHQLVKNPDCSPNHYQSCPSECNLYFSLQWTNTKVSTRKQMLLTKHTKLSFDTTAYLINHEFRWVHTTCRAKTEPIMA